MVNFIQDDDGWDIRGPGGESLGRVSEAAAGYALSIHGRGGPRTFADLTDAQAAALDTLSPGWRVGGAGSGDRVDGDAGTQSSRTVTGTRPRQAAPWKGGPKRHTKFARAVGIMESILAYASSGGRMGYDNRDRSPAHTQAYDLALEAKGHLSTAQELSGIASAHRHEMRHRSRGARLLAKAEALMPEVRRVDAGYTDALLDSLASERDGAPEGPPRP